MKNHDSLDPFDTQLRGRMERLEASLPHKAPFPRRSTSRAKWTAGVIALVLAALTTGVALGATVFSDAVRGHPGLFAPGGALQCSGIQEMSPPQAANVLEELGYSVTWQIENRDDGSSIQSPRPPTEGYVIEGVLNGRDMTLVVEVGENAEPASPVC
jgi:hypothetical protein